MCMNFFSTVLPQSRVTLSVEAFCVVIIYYKIDIEELFS